MAELKNPIKEAERYLANARQILSEKAEKDGNYYNDSKYVKLAGHAAWSGVLVALDGALNVKDNFKSGQTPEFKDYQAAVAKRDKKMTRVLLSAYNSLHKSLGYEGNPSYKGAQAALEDGKYLVSWASKQYNQTKAAK